MATVKVTEETFKEKVLDSDKVVLVDFWATWCGPCLRVAPILEKISEERKEKLVIAKVDVDENQALAARYGIVSIPTMIAFKGGEPVKTMIGARPQQAIEAELGDLL